LVDDQADVQRVFQRSLTKAGHQVVLARSGERALALCAESEFDLVVSDVQMCTRFNKASLFRSKR
jgi:CheY-like chemotaxis protein